MNRGEKQEPLAHIGRAIRRPPREQPPKVEMDQREKPARSYLGFSCNMLSLATVSSMVSSPTCHACREICCAEGSGSIYEGLRAWNGQSYPSKKLPPTLGAPCASISAGESASRRGGLVGTRRLDALVSLRRQDHLETASGNGRRIIAEQRLDLARARFVRV